MKTIKVAAAVIKTENREGRDLVFATQRGYGEYKGCWEFPGGKLETGETSQEALKREMIEELAVKIEVGDLIDTVEFDYPTFHLSMDCFWCTFQEGDPVLKEHESARWLRKDQLLDVEWLPADITILDRISSEMK